MTTRKKKSTTKPSTAPKSSEADPVIAMDPFSPEALTMEGKDISEMGVKTVLVELACRKPGKQEWVRTHPDLCLDCALLKLEDSNEFYLVVPEMTLDPTLFEMAKRYHIQLATTRAGSMFFWPVPVPEEQGSGISWHRSGIKCQRIAQDNWTRVKADMAAGAYTPLVAMADLPEPEWPTLDMRSLLELCFKARMIDSEDHSVLKLLRGEV